VKYTARIDVSLVMLVVVLVLFGGAVWQMARAFPDAGRGFIVYAREQKDLFVDAGLIRESYRVPEDEKLNEELREQTVIVAARTSPHTAYMGAGVIVGRHKGQLVILTAKHIVTHRGTKVVLFRDHTERVASRIIHAPHEDLALVYIPDVPSTPYRVARLAGSTFATGDRFVVLGHPGAQSWTASPGIAERHLHYTLLFCPSCDRGDSGAGAFDGDGRLHGIVVTKAIMRAPEADTGRYIDLTAFEIEDPRAIRAFLRTAS
jgi:hypothetical protein